MTLYEMLLPVADNDGRAFEHGTRDAFLARVLDIAGGYTLCPEVKGAWRFAGRDYIESMTPLRVACDRSQIEAIAKDALTTFKQREIFNAQLGTTLEAPALTLAA